MASGLARVDAAGRVIMAADSTNKAVAPGRRSVRVTSRASYNGGLFVHEVSVVYPCMIVRSRAASSSSPRLAV